MAKDSGMGTILTLGAVAVGGYFVYEKFFANALPADAFPYGGQMPSETITIPSGIHSNPVYGNVDNTAALTFTGPGYVYYGPAEKQFYFSTTAPTAAQIAAGQAFVQVAPPSTVSGNLPGTAATVTVTPPVVPPVGPSLASIYSNVLAGASTDPNFTGAGDALDSTGYRWNVYTGLALPGKAVPALPGVDLSQNMTARDYWNAMGPAIGSAYGLSGLG